MPLTPIQLQMAEGWYGYGRWAAPYWFIGLEPGGDEIDACARMWDQLGRGELLDIVEHHRQHDKDWFSAASGAQPTWQKLIWLLLAYQGQVPSKTATRKYQQEKLGRLNGETALIELSSIPARNHAIDVPRELFRDHRIDIIRQNLHRSSPGFVVFYSPDHRYLNLWQAIAGCTKLTAHEPVRVGQTAYVVTYHPNGKWAKSYWSNLGAKLRALQTPARP
jgi:hypothetical protein